MHTSLSLIVALLDATLCCTTPCLTLAYDLPPVPVPVPVPALSLFLFLRCHGGCSPESQRSLISIGIDNRGEEGKASDKARGSRDKCRIYSRQVPPPAATSGQADVARRLSLDRLVFRHSSSERRSSPETAARAMI
ncbi:hypothetical protein B0T16DRAFT_443382 [Cercophora newfieldiana]|uniref:Secreted protein n=1 Tax=Cercophora newfieldiana TaxID=92897 RepID=A0AA40CWT8_9PEZI|nr:hypothetical protein B0T16DRAFT_443382 [Cercophora newfieldiana]